MIAAHTKVDYIMERKRSEIYIRHAKSLLEVAESEITTEGSLISAEGLNRLKKKLINVDVN